MAPVKSATTWKDGHLVDKAGRQVLPSLWFTSRTPTVEGQTHCRMARFLGYHAGPHGTGYRRRSLSVPLATGGAVHVGVQLLAEWVLEWQAKHHGMPPNLVNPLHERAGLPLEVIAWAATEAAARYERSARAKGFLERGLEAIGTDLVDTETGEVRDSLTGQDAQGRLPAPVEQLILEQRTLIEAQVWVFATILLPQMLSQYRILGVEQEESLVLDCSCGLGDGVADWTVHHDRDCSGIVQMGRADLLLEGWADQVRGQIVYDEVKTKATPNLPWETAWEHSGQLRVNMETAGRRLGKRVTAAYIPVLFKGWRGRDRGAATDAPKYQHTPLVYGYYDPGSAGFRQPEWKAQYKWTDDYGKGHSLPRTFEKQAVWDEALPLPGVAGTRREASRVERWVLGYITPKQWPELTKLLGPFPYAAALMPDTIKGILAEEQMWREDVAAIREQLAEGDDRPEVVIAADRISRSWQCTSFSGEPCPFRPVCEKNPGWEQPATMGLYDIRTPHHATEKAAYEAVGVQFPAGDDGEDDQFEEFEV